MITMRFFPPLPTSRLRVARFVALVGLGTAVIASCGVDKSGLGSMPFLPHDASAGGLGGCPYAPGAAGNLATDDLIYMLDGLGIETGVSLAAVSEASTFIASKIDHPLPSRYFTATQSQVRG